MKETVFGEDVAQSVEEGSSGRGMDVRYGEVVALYAYCLVLVVQLCEVGGGEEEIESDNEGQENEGEDLEHMMR